MEPDFIGGINQVGTSNLQVINDITVNVNISINGKTSHIQQKKVSNQGEHLHQFLDSLQKLTKSFGHTAQITTQSQSELVIKSQSNPTTQAKDEEIRNKTEKKVSRLGQLGKALWPKSATQTRSDVNDQIDPAPQMEAVATDSVRIVDARDQVLEPGDAVLLKICMCGVLSLYVGDGFVVRYDEDSMTVVKEKFDMTIPFRKWIIRSEGNLNVYSWEWRVHRALQRVGRPCPVQFGEGVDFVLWTFTGLSCEQSIERGFYLDF